METLSTWEAIYHRDGPKSLRELMNQVVQTPDQDYYLTKLLGYDYLISYKPSKSNIVAGTLSRRDVPYHPKYLF